MAYSEISLERPEAGLSKDAAADDLYRVGLVYSIGMGVAIDLVAAHKWFNLAASRGSTEARVCRQEIADQMSAREVAQAQRAAREWLSQRN